MCLQLTSSTGNYNKTESRQPTGRTGPGREAWWEEVKGAAERAWKGGKAAPLGALDSGPTSLTIGHMRAGGWEGLPTQGSEETVCRGPRGEPPSQANPPSPAAAGPHAQPPQGPACWPAPQLLLHSWLHFFVIRLPCPTALPPPPCAGEHQTPGQMTASLTQGRSHQSALLPQGQDPGHMTTQGDPTHDTLLLGP